jgi:hypothetical protein
LDPVAQTGLDPGPLRQCAPDQLEILTILADEDQDDTSRRLEGHEVDPRVCAQQTFGDRAQAWGEARDTEPEGF